MGDAEAQQAQLTAVTKEATAKALLITIKKLQGLKAEKGRLEVEVRGLQVRGQWGRDGAQGPVAGHSGRVGVGHMDWVHGSARPGSRGLTLHGAHAPCTCAVAGWQQLLAPTILQEELAAAQAELASAQAAAAAAAAAEAAVRAAGTAGQATLAELQAASTADKAALAAAARQLEQLWLEAAQAAAATEAAHAAASQLGSQVGALQGQLAEARSSAAELQRLLDSSRAECAALQGQLALAAEEAQGIAAEAEGLRAARALLAQVCNSRCPALLQASAHRLPDCGSVPKTRTAHSLGKAFRKSGIACHVTALPCGLLACRSSMRQSCGWSERRRLERTFSDVSCRQGEGQRPNRLCASKLRLYCGGFKCTAEHACRCALSLCLSCKKLQGGLLALCLQVRAAVPLYPHSMKCTAL